MHKGGGKQKRLNRTGKKIVKKDKSGLKSTGSDAFKMTR